jgi:plasmid maintenance system antidote protein VapI
MIIRYLNIKAEFKKLGLTNKKVAAILEISPQNLDYLIKQDKPRIHWITFGLANYYGGIDDNLIKEMNNDS